MGRVAGLFTDCDEIFSHHCPQHIAPYFWVLTFCCPSLLCVVFDRATDFHLGLPCSKLAAFSLLHFEISLHSHGLLAVCWGKKAGNRDVLKQHPIMLQSFWTVCAPGVAGRRVTLVVTLLRMVQGYTVSVEFRVETSPSLTPGLLCLDSQGGRKHSEV